ncbi:hypothetical protein AcV5_001917 [Taiwanofungus camphoratus]|nr:hypothetical protein AcV5_001917 [Antrodia cinnamomea]
MAQPFTTSAQLHCTVATPLNKLISGTLPCTNLEKVHYQTIASNLMGRTSSGIHFLLRKFTQATNIMHLDDRPILVFISTCLQLSYNQFYIRLRLPFPSRHEVCRFEGLPVKDMYLHRAYNTLDMWGCFAGFEA